MGFLPWVSFSILVQTAARGRVWAGMACLHSAAFPQDSAGAITDIWVQAAPAAAANSQSGLTNGWVSPTLAVWEAGLRLSWVLFTFPLKRIVNTNSKASDLHSISKTVKSVCIHCICTSSNPVMKRQYIFIKETLGQHINASAKHTDAPNYTVLKHTEL